MKVFLSYSSHDSKMANWLIEKLEKEKDITILNNRPLTTSGKELNELIAEVISDADYVIMLISEHSLDAKWLRLQVDKAFFNEIKKGKQIIIPILIDKIAFEILPLMLPNIENRSVHDFSEDQAVGYKSLKNALKKKTKPQKHITDLIDSSKKYDEINKNFITSIKQEYKRGNVTLFCGAGISIDAGVQNWSFLLKSLLQNLVNKQLNQLSLDYEEQKFLAELYYEEFGVSSLIIGQYLKNGLANEFLEQVRSALYANNPTTSNLIKAIIELCRPQRDKKALHSIISFNFDDLIENNLKDNNVKHCSIYKEGQRAESAEIPVYHVHGYLPRNSNLTEENQIVFSEDAYHSQFIEPFSWSNLVQLNHLNQNTCVLVGLSLTDPNLRRLLDVSMRKNPSKSLRHYIIKRKYNPEEVKRKITTVIPKNPNLEFTEEFIYMTEILEEQDARNLGLNVIWVKEFEDFTNVLLQILED